MKQITQFFRHLKRMPEMLAALSCLLMFFGVLLLVGAILPISNWTYEGRSLSYGEFWRSGAGILVAATCLVMILLAVGFYRAQHWVRYAIPLGFVGLTVYAALRRDPQFRYEWIGALFWVFFSYWYFNRKRKVVAYFSSVPGAEPAGSTEPGGGASVSGREPSAPGR